MLPVTERPAPAGPPWQHAWPVQPISSVQRLTPQSVSYTPPGVTSAPEFTPPTGHARLIEPGADGGCEWEPPAYSPRTGDVYYEARYLPALYTANRAKPNGGTIGGEITGAAPAGEILGSNATGPVPGVRHHAIVGAVNTTTGRIAWEHGLPVLAKSGLLVAGSLVFYGENDGTFTAANASTATPLWTFQANRYGTAFQESLNGDAVVAFALPGPHYTGPRITYSDIAFKQG